MKTRGWITLVILVGGLVWASRACRLNTVDPDQRVAAHLDALCEIARDHVRAPEKGVRTMGRYLGKHTGDLTGALGSTIATIERIQDDAYHDERARIARERIQGPLRACERDWARFAQAVEADPEASALVERALRRLNRTLEIIFGRSAAGRTLRDLPGELARAISG